MGGDCYFELTEDIRLDLLELYGRGYVIDHCIASLRKRNKELGYRVYVTDTLKMIAENTAKQVGGYSPSARYYDTLKPKAEITAKQVISKMKKKIGGGK